MSPLLCWQSNKCIFFCLNLVANCCMENESAREETAGASRKTRRSTSQSEERITKESSKPNTCPIGVPESKRRSLSSSTLNRQDSPFFSTFKHILLICALFIFDKCEIALMLRNESSIFTNPKSPINLSVFQYRSISIAFLHCCSFRLLASNYVYSHFEFWILNLEIKIKLYSLISIEWFSLLWETIY